MYVGNSCIPLSRRPVFFPVDFCIRPAKYLSRHHRLSIDMRHIPRLLSDGGRCGGRAPNVRPQASEATLLWPLSLCGLSLRLLLGMPSPDALSLPLELLSEGQQPLLIDLGVESVAGRPNRQCRCGVVVHMYMMSPAAAYDCSTTTDDLRSRTGYDVRGACDGVRQFDMKLLFLHSRIGAFHLLESFLGCRGHLLMRQMSCQYVQSSEC